MFVIPEYIMKHPVFQMTVVVKIKHFMFSNIFRQSFRLCDNVEKNIIGAGQPTDDSMAHAHYTLDT